MFQWHWLTFAWIFCAFFAAGLGWELAKHIADAVWRRLTAKPPQPNP